MLDNYLEDVKKQFAYYKQLGEKTFAQLDDDKALFWQFNEASNSIAIIVQHLWGNMLSRWTNFLTEDGEKPWRQRDLEFEAVITNRAEMMTKWEEGWQCLFEALDSIKEEHYNQLVYIRNQGHTLVEAINRQMAHYAYHVGQLVFLGKMLKDNDWQSLTIPKGQSASFNQEKFAQPKDRGHFTDDLKK